MLADLGAEDEVLVVSEMLALLEGRQGVDDLGHHRHRADPLALRHALDALLVVKAPANVKEAADEIDLAPPEREKLAGPEPGVRRHSVKRSVLIALGMGGEQLDLVAIEGVELSRVDELRSLDEVSRRRVLLNAPHSASSLEDAVEDRQVADDRPRRKFALRDQSLLVGVDVVRRDGLQGH